MKTGSVIRLAASAGRRHFLKACPLALCLPMLQTAIRPSLVSAAVAAAPPKRLIFLGGGYGFTKQTFYPTEAGRFSKIGASKGLKPKAPFGEPARGLTGEQEIKIMFDMIVLALQTDSTRVVSYRLPVTALIEGDLECGWNSRFGILDLVWVFEPSRLIGPL